MVWLALGPFCGPSDSEQWLFFPVKTIKMLLLSDLVMGFFLPFYLPLTNVLPGDAYTRPSAALQTVVGLLILQLLCGCPWQPLQDSKHDL